MGNGAREGLEETRAGNRAGGGRPREAQCEHVDAGSGAAGDAWRRGDTRTRSHEPLPTRVEDLPELPQQFAQLIRDGLEGLAVPDLAPDAWRVIDAHARLLLAWTASINLTAIRAPLAVARDHVLDSLTALPVLREAGVTRLVDIGSGGGYPGIPLGAALGAERTLLVESIGKKARFLATVAHAVDRDDRISVAATRAERLGGDPHHRERWAAVVVRAVGDLAEDAELGLPLLALGGLLVAWQRETQSGEVDAAIPLLDRLGGRLREIRAVRLEGLRDHRLVVVEKVSPTPAAFPRDPAVRRRGR